MRKNLARYASKLAMILQSFACNLHKPATPDHVTVYGYDAKADRWNCIW